MILILPFINANFSGFTGAYFKFFIKGGNMKIRVQSIHFTADIKLLDFIQKKADKLDRLIESL